MSEVDRSSVSTEQCLQVTTYRPDGTPVMTTVIWPLPWGDGRIAFVMPRQSGKFERLQNNPRIKLQPADWDGFPLEGRLAVEGRAELVFGADLEKLLRIMIEKYGREGWAATMGRGNECPESRGGCMGDVGVIVSFG
ncbi:pyridoxamine 5'-phosphate oxidase family protein [Nocardia sp. NPDC059246]|uniref:pyridoxamine 5'-phosphate oxidase family protein n=1 Tax=unclassified Nocardia TaxID=2637762 RepID=UPI0036BBD0B2